MTEADLFVARLLEAASAAVAASRYVWLATAGGARPMGLLPRLPGDDPWRLRFVTDDRSVKVADIWRNGEVAVLVQREAQDQYLRLTGPAVLHPGARNDARLWREAYRAYFPTEEDADHAAFLEIEARGLDLWLRGVTPEPFGLRTTTLERDAQGSWRCSR